MDFSYLDDWTDEEAGPEIEEVGEGYRNIWVDFQALMYNIIDFYFFNYLSPFTRCHTTNNFSPVL